MSDEAGNTKRLSTRQLLAKIPNATCLYRHKLTGVYYGIKKLRRKRKEHSLDTSDRKIADRKLKEWLAGLDKLDPELEKTTLNQLLDKFQKTREGRADKTKKTESWIIKMLKADWGHGLDIRVSAIRPSMLDEWLAKHEPHLKSSSYNRVTLFLKQLFDLAVNDRIIIESPFGRLQKGWKKPEKPKRIVPTDEQFAAIVKDIREQKLNVDAEESADFVEFLGLAGLGEAEAGSIIWEDVDWQKAQVAVRRRKTKVLFSIPLYPDLKPFMQRLYAKHETPPPSDKQIFKMRTARKALGNACKRLKYPAFTPRSIRAYLIRRLWQAKIDVKLIAKWQGHNDGGKLILNTYTEVFGGNDAEYVTAELSKLGTVPAHDKPVTLSATEHKSLLAELQKLRAQLAPVAQSKKPTNEIAPQPNIEATAGI